MSAPGPSSTSGGLNINRRPKQIGWTSYEDPVLAIELYGQWSFTLSKQCIEVVGSERDLICLQDPAHTELKSPLFIWTGTTLLDLKYWDLGHIFHHAKNHRAGSGLVYWRESGNMVEYIQKVTQRLRGPGFMNLTPGSELDVFRREDQAWTADNKNVIEKAFHDYADHIPDEGFNPSQPGSSVFHVPGTDWRMAYVRFESPGRNMELLQFALYVSEQPFIRAPPKKHTYRQVWLFVDRRSSASTDRWEKYNAPSDIDAVVIAQYVAMDQLGILGRDALRFYSVQAQTRAYSVHPYVKLNSSWSASLMTHPRGLHAKSGPDIKYVCGSELNLCRREEPWSPDSDWQFLWVAPKGTAVEDIIANLIYLDMGLQHRKHRLLDREGDHQELKKRLLRKLGIRHLQVGQAPVTGSLERPLVLDRSAYGKLFTDLYRRNAKGNNTGFGIFHHVNYR